MLQISTVTPDTLELLKELQLMPELAETRLVGGTALSFHLGHRLSIDLDLFGTFNQETITKTLEDKQFNTFTVLSEVDVIKRYLINQIKVDIVKYDRYKWLEETVIEDNMKVAGLKDIAAMKIAAITNRGTKKDFVDMFFLLKIFSIQEIIEFYQEKYFDANLFFAIYSLAYFEDAEKDEMPRMLIPATWEEVKQRIIAEVKQI